MRTVLVTGTILSADGVPARGGTVAFELSAVGRCLVDGTVAVVARLVRVGIDPRGRFELRVIPNSAIGPEGTYYRVTLAPSGQPPWSENVIIPPGCDSASFPDLERV